MLSYNVASLLRAAPGTTETYQLAVGDLDVAEGIELAAPVTGQVRLSLTGRGILVRADLRTAISGNCRRCLKPVVTPVELEMEEEALPLIDIGTGLPVDTSVEPDALRLTDHHELDLEVPIREAISLADPIAVLCRADCRGLCPECGQDMNDNPAHAHADDDVDPRLAVLAEWRGNKE